MTTEYTITGTAIEITELKIDREYHERTIVVGTGGRYPKTVPVRFSDRSGETASKLDRIGTGDRVIVTFDLSGRKSKDGKWFTSADGWACEIVERKNAAQTQRTERRPADRDDGPPPPSDDDLPPGLRH